MKKKLTFWGVFFTVSILAANVCWDNGSPLYEGNFIYHSHSIRTADNDIYITWVEADEEMRKLKLQKTDYQGIPLWAQPLTIDESSEFMINLDLLNSIAGDLFVEVRSDASDSKLLYKIDENGSLLWSNEFNEEYFEEFLPLDNGGAINLRFGTIQSYDHLIGTYFDNQGNVIWDDISLTILPDQLQNYEIVCREFINNELHVVAYLCGYIYYMKFDENGNPLYISGAFSALHFGTGKFMNDHFYVLFNDEDVDELKMWKFDLEGNSVSGPDPFTICRLGDYHYRYLLAGDDYFNCLSRENNDSLKLLKCDYQGNLLEESLIEVMFYGDLLIYDQEQDFICISGNGSNGYESYLIKIDASGAGEPIFYLPENIYNDYFWFHEKYYINDGFTMTGKISYGHESISSLRKADTSNTLHEIREIESEIIQPTLIKRADGLHAHWYSYTRNAIMTQVINEDGQALLDVNGEVLIENVSSFFYYDDVYYCFKISSYENTADTVSIRAYDLTGSPLWANSEAFIIQAGYHNHIGIAPFSNGLLFHIATDQGSWIDSEMEAMYFNETGFLWDETVTLDFGLVSTYESYEFKNNYLFHVYNNNVFGVKINENGSCEDQFLLAANSDFYGTYGTEDDFLVKTHIHNDMENALYYFHAGESMWNDPLYVSEDRYYGLQPFFAEDHFYLTGFNYVDSVEVHQFDLEKNFIAENSFGFNLVNPHTHVISTYHKSDNFIFFISGSNAQYDHEFSYTIYDEAGNQLVAEFEETLMNRPNNEYIQDIEFAGNNAYLDLTTGIKIEEGYYERNHYLQKIDLSEFVGTIDDEINLTDILYSIRAYPNPFNPATTISFSIPEESEIELTIYNLKGQKVKQLVSEQLEEGQYSIVWNGIDKTDKPVASGIYFYQMNVNGKTRTVKKCLLLK